MGYPPMESPHYFPLAIIQRDLEEGYNFSYFWNIQQIKSQGSTTDKYVGFIVVKSIWICCIQFLFIIPIISKYLYLPNDSSSCRLLPIYCGSGNIILKLHYFCYNSNYIIYYPDFIGNTIFFIKGYKYKKCTLALTILFYLHQARI